MLIPTSCPDEAALRQLLRQQVAGPRRAELALHVWKCPHCRGLLRRLRGGETLREQLGAPSTRCDPDVPEPAPADDFASALRACGLEPTTLGLAALEADTPLTGFASPPVRTWGDEDEDAALSPGQAPPAFPRCEGRRRTREALRRGLWYGVAGGLLGLLLVAGFLVLRVTNGNGQAVAITVPEGGQAVIAPSGHVRVTPPRPDSSPFDRLRAEDIPALQRPEPPLPGLVAVLGESTWRHAGEIACVGFTSDGRTVASGGMAWDGRYHVLTLWDRMTGQAKSSFRLPYAGGFTNAYAVTPDGTMAIVGQAYGGRVWDVATGKDHVPLPPARVNLYLTLSADGSRLGIASYVNTGGLLQVVDLRSGKLLAERGVPFFRWAAFAPDLGTAALAAFEDEERLEKRRIELWDMTSGERRKLASVQPISPTYAAGAKLRFSADGKTLAVREEDGVRLWDVRAGRPFHVVPVSRDFKSDWCLSPDGRLLATANLEGTLCLWEVPSGRLVRSLPGLTTAILAVAFAPDGRVLAAGGRAGIVGLWDVATGQMLNPISGSEGPAGRLAVSADGRLLAWQDATFLRLWNVPAARQQWAVRGRSPLAAVALPAAGRTAVSGGKDGAVSLWEIETGSERQTLGNGQLPVAAVAASANGDFLAVAIGTEVRLWATSQGPHFTLRLPSGNARSAAFSADSSLLAAGSDDGTVLVWEVESGRELHRFKQREEPIHGLAFAPDGTALAQADGHLRPTYGGKPTVPGEVVLWDLRTGRALGQYRCHTDVITAVVFAADGRSLFSAGYGDHRVIEWRDAVPQRVWRFAAPVNDLALSPEGRHLLATSGNGTIAVLRLAAATP